MKTRLWLSLYFGINIFIINETSAEELLKKSPPQEQPVKKAPSGGGIPAVSNKLPDVSSADLAEIYDITINSNWKFTALTFSADNYYYIDIRYLPSDLLGTVPETFYVEIDGKRYFKIDKAKITTEDIEQLKLVITLTEEYFKTQQVAFSGQKRGESTAIDAIFLNYDFNVLLNDISQTVGTLDFNYASKNNWRLKNQAFWTGTDLVRLYTTWQTELENNRKLIIGDTTGPSTSNFGSVNMFGFRYATSYYNNSLFLQDSLPTLSLSGFSVNPSALDLYINNQMVQRTEVASGKYSVNLPYRANGYGVAQAYVYDINNRPTIVSVPFYNSIEMLKKGANEYDVSAGLIRRNLGIESYDYDTPLASGVYKGGWADGYTQDFYAQYSDLYWAGSALAHLTPFPRIGMINLGYGRNSYGQSTFRVGLDRVSTTSSIGADYQQSIGDEPFCYGLGQDCIFKQIRAYAGTALPFGLGSINSNYITRETLDSITTIKNIQFTRQLTKRIGLFANFSDVSGTVTPNKTIYVGLSVNLDGGFFTNTSMTQDTTGDSYQQSIYKGENPNKPYLGYGSLTYNQMDENATQNLYYGARLDNLAYQANFYRDQKGTVGNLNVSGGLVYIPEEKYFRFTKQIQNGLAFVKVKNLTEPIQIDHENRFAGYTDKKGRFLIADAVALNNERVTVDINKLPNGVTLDYYKKEYYVPQSGAVRVDFTAKPLPFVVQILGVKDGSIFNIGDDYYVVGEEGFTAVDLEGKAKIPDGKGGTCELDIKQTQKEYNCGKPKDKNE